MICREKPKGDRKATKSLQITCLYRLCRCLTVWTSLLHFSISWANAFQEPCNILLDSIHRIHRIYSLWPTTWSLANHWSMHRSIETVSMDWSELNVPPILTSLFFLLHSGLPASVRSFIFLFHAFVFRSQIVPIMRRIFLSNVSIFLSIVLVSVQMLAAG